MIVLEDARIGVLGFEPRLTDSESVRIRVFPEENGTCSDLAAPGAADDPENGPIDPDLRFIVERWDELSEPVKAGIIAMVRAADSPPGRILSGVKTGAKPSYPEEFRSESE